MTLKSYTATSAENYLGNVFFKFVRQQKDETVDHSVGNMLRSGIPGSLPEVCLYSKTWRKISSSTVVPLDFDPFLHIY